MTFAVAFCNPAERRLVVELIDARTELQAALMYLEEEEGSSHVADSLSDLKEQLLGADVLIDVTHFIRRKKAGSW